MIQYQGCSSSQSHHAPGHAVHIGPGIYICSPIPDNSAKVYKAFSHPSPRTFTRITRDGMMISCPSFCYDLQAHGPGFCMTNPVSPQRAGLANVLVTEAAT